jgi:GH24 family phage-related lysozyme (muramidase)
MRNIRDLIPKKNYKAIAKEFRKMKRIWEGKNLDGLLTRREAEAKLIESCV